MMNKIGPPPRPKFFDVWNFPRMRIKLFVFGPIRFGFQIRDRWKFKLQAPIKSEIGIRFCGFLIDYFLWSIWIYVPAIAIHPPRKAILRTLMRIPGRKGR